MRTYVYSFLEKKGFFLLLKRPSDKKVNPGFWCLPGGRLEEGETYADCVVREVSEETNLEFIPITQVMDVVEKVVDGEIRVVVYSGTHCGIVNISKEHTEYKWVDIDEIKEMEVLPFINELVARREK